MVRYSEDPAVQVEAHVSAPPAVVWPLVSDITLPARFPPSCRGLRRIGRRRRVTLAQMIELAGELSREPA